MKKIYKRRFFESLLNRNKSKKARIGRSMLSVFIITALLMPLIIPGYGVTSDRLLAAAGLSDEVASITEITAIPEGVNAEPEKADTTDTNTVSPQDANPEDLDTEESDTEGSGTEVADSESTDMQDPDTEGTVSESTDIKNTDSTDTDTDTETETGRPETGNIETMEPEIGDIETIQSENEGTELVIDDLLTPMQAPGTMRYAAYWSVGSGFIIHGTYQTLAEAVRATSTPNESRSYYIHVLGDDPGMTAAVTIPSNRNYTISSMDPRPHMPPPDAIRTINMTRAVRHFIVEGSLTLENIILDGNLTGGGVQVNSNRTFTMNTGSVIRRCVSSRQDADRRIGGGVFVANGNMIMNDDSLITENFANKYDDHFHGYGGGVYLQGGKLTMDGNSSISGNIGNDFSSGSARGGAGGGVFLALSAAGVKSELIMTGNSSISDNIASTGHTLKTESYITGGGVYISQACEFNMSGNASLTGNVAGANRRGNGGAVYIAGGQSDAGRFTMNSGTFIRGNYASTALNGTSDGGTSNGGGVHVCQRGLFTMNGGTISDNYAATGDGAAGQGGGVSITDSGSRFIMRGGTIRGNTAGKNGPGDGGGIHLTLGSAEIQAGTISGNSAPNGHGGGIYTSELFHNNLTVNAAVNIGRFNDNSDPNTASIKINLEDFKFNESVYRQSFNSIHSPFGPRYSTESNHPVNNYDINIQVHTVIEKHVDTFGRELEPAVLDNTFAVPRVVAIYEREIPGISYHIVRGYKWDTVPDSSVGTDFAEGDSVRETIRNDRVIYFVYLLEVPPMGVSLSSSGAPIIPLLLAVALIPIGFKIAGLIRRRRVSI